MLRMTPISRNCEVGRFECRRWPSRAKRSAVCSRGYGRGSPWRSFQINVPCARIASSR